MANKEVALLLPTSASEELHRTILYRLGKAGYSSKLGPLTDYYKSEDDVRQVWWLDTENKRAAHSQDIPPIDKLVDEGWEVTGREYVPEQTQMALNFFGHNHEQAARFLLEQGVTEELVRKLEAGEEIV